IFVWLLSGSSFDVDTIQAAQFLLALLVILPPALLMGGVFPLTMRIYAGGVDRVGRDVGAAYAANTVGAIFGSFLAGFVVLPLLGLQRGICVAAGLDLLLGAALFARAELPARARWGLAAVLPIVFAAVALALPRWRLEHFQLGLFRI